jgi:P4 family phage/plasmid primase-like protien
MPTTDPISSAIKDRTEPVPTNNNNNTAATIPNGTPSLDGLRRILDRSHGRPGDALPIALAYHRAGFTPLPIRLDGTKSPSGPEDWKPFQAGMEEQQVKELFENKRVGVAIIAGPASGNLVVLDVEYPDFFAALVEAVEAVKPGLIQGTLPIVKTPGKTADGGRHIYFRTARPHQNMKLAKLTPEEAENRTGDKGSVTAIETKATGGYVLAPGCPPAAHKTGRRYELMNGPTVEETPEISEEDYSLIVTVARNLSQTPIDVDDEEDQERHQHEAVLVNTDRPGDHYNWQDDAIAAWLALLTPLGYTEDHRDNGVLYLTRPGKQKGVSVSIGFCTSKRRGVLAYVFSTNCEPLQADRSYSLFEAFAAFHHGGNFPEAARVLAAKGFCSTEHHLTDRGNAMRVIERHGHDLHYCHPTKTWYVWNGVRWAEDDTAQVAWRIKETQAALYKTVAAELKATNVKTKKKQLAYKKKLLVHLLKWEDQRRVTACLDSLKSEPEIPILPAQLDTDHYLLNVKNGTINLRTGELRPHRREDLITKMAPVEHDPDAKAPLWWKFLARIMGDDEDRTIRQRHGDDCWMMVRYLRRVIGYSLTGDVSEQAIWFLYGTGENGKSTFLKTLIDMLGDYALQTVSDLLVQKKHEAHSTERVDLCGKRFAATIETDEGKKIAEALLKQMTGGDKLRGRKLFRDNIEFDPTHKIFLAANHKPVVTGTDHGFWRRINLVPFEVTITKEEKDKHLLDKLKAEWPGILASAVKGCKEWQKGGLQVPTKVTDTTKTYREEQDTLSGFISECCNVLPEARVRTNALHNAYAEWTGDKWTTQKQFAQRMRDKGFEVRASTGNASFCFGIGLPADAAS